MSDNDDADASGFLQSLQAMLGVFAFGAGRRPQRPIAEPTSRRSRNLRKRQTWLQADAYEYVQRDASDLREDDPAEVKRTLRALKHLVQDDPEVDTDSNLEGYENERFPSRDPHADLGAVIRVRKRGREYDDAIQGLSRLGQDSKKRRFDPPAHEEPARESSLDDPNTDFAVLMRRHLASLDNALRRQWVCVCQNCSGLSVRLSLPQHKQGANLKTLESEASFEVFFGVRSVPASKLQEARITVKDLLRNRLVRSSSEPPALSSSPPAFAHHILCQSITESIGKGTCLHFALEDGVFQRLNPQRMTFRSDRISSSVSLSALFQRQQELSGGKSVLPFKGKAVLAAALASALLPFLETPWLQFSFNHSKIQFFEPRQDGELPDITKPFLALEHVPVMPARTTTSTGDDSKHIIHPNASVLALGILLCELHFCTPVELMAKDTPAAAGEVPGAMSINDACYICLDKLQILQDEAGVDYFLATQACLNGDYYPIGQRVEFDDLSVQRSFYQNVVKRLENVISKAWEIRLGDLGSFDARTNESCWGPIGREVVRLHAGQIDSHVANDASTRGFNWARSQSDSAPVGHSHPDMVLRLSSKPSLSTGSQAQGLLAEHSENSGHFFDASHHMGPGSEVEDPVSRKWMDNIQSSIFRYVPPALDLVEPVRIAILDSGFDPTHPLVFDNPQIKANRSFVYGTQYYETKDEIGHGTHALGLLLQVAPCAEIYVARVARGETLNSNTFNDITKAIDYAVNEWKVDVISMSFGIREDYEPMTNAIANALKERTLLFAAASNDGANLDRAFPAQHRGVFCIHSTDGKGNPSDFNPSPSEDDVNYSLLGHQVSSHWPAGLNGHQQDVRPLSGTSVATPIAAGLAASVLSFVRRKDQKVAAESERLGPWLTRDTSMNAVFRNMVKRRQGYHYIMPELLFDRHRDSTEEDVYRKIRDIKRNMYMHQT